MDGQKFWYSINCDPPRRQAFNGYTIPHATQIIKGFPRKWALVTVSVLLFQECSLTNSKPLCHVFHKNLQVMLNIVHNNVYFVHIAAHHYFLQKQDMMRISFYLKLRKQYICYHIKLCKLVPHLTKVMKQKMYTANIQQCLQFLQYVYQQTQAASYTAVPSLVTQFLLKDAASHI